MIKTWENEKPKKISPDKRAKVNQCTCCMSASRPILNQWTLFGYKRIQLYSRLIMFFSLLLSCKICLMILYLSLSRVENLLHLGLCKLRTLVFCITCVVDQYVHLFTIGGKLIEHFVFLATCHLHHFFANYTLFNIWHIKWWWWWYLCILSC